MTRRTWGYVLFAVLGFLIFGLLAGVLAERAAGRRDKTAAQRTAAFFVGLVVGGVVGAGLFTLALFKVLS